MNMQNKSFENTQIHQDNSLDQLKFLLARHNHNKWYQSRSLSGWSFNEQHNEAQKQSPFMLPFNELPEDKQMHVLEDAQDTLNTIIDSGYRVLKPEGITDFLPQLPTLEKLLESEVGSSIDSMVLLWRNRNPQLWQKNPTLFLKAGKKMLSAGEPLLAYDVLSEGAESMGGFGKLGELEGQAKLLLTSLLQQKALALAQSGASADANSLLRSLQDFGLSDGETLGILGRTWKDMAMQSKNAEERKSFFEEAFSCYNKTYISAYNTGDFDAAYYTGINAAAISLLSGDLEQSKHLATQVQDICAKIQQEKNENNEPIQFWLYASLGEASLLQNDITKAEEWYIKAAQGCSRDIRAMGSMRKQARRILEASGKNNNALDHCFPVLSVVLFSGHLLDMPTQKSKRFPKENEELVRSRIADWLEEYNGQIGYASGACGSDLLFLEEMLKRGGEINIVLPFEEEHFIETSVDVIPGSNWVDRFKKVLAKANEIKILSQYNEVTLDDDLLFTNLYLYGTAQVRAERAGTDLKTLLVWDRNTAKSIAGTAALADLIKMQDGSFDVISPLKSENRSIADTDSSLSISDESGSSTPLMVGKNKACHYAFLPLLIADVKGYSRLDKREKLLFASNFMGEMAVVLNPFDDTILGKKTQGDSLFMVFRDLQACVQSARALQERATAIDWTNFGLSSQPTMRISLDAGPCYSYTDPITDQLDFCGDYIVRAARLEPVTPPGNIYASETFVAVAKALGIKGIKFNYAGQVELPKGYGRMQAFHVK